MAHGPKASDKRSYIPRRSPCRAPAEVECVRESPPFRSRFDAFDPAGGADFHSTAPGPVWALFAIPGGSGLGS